MQQEGQLHELQEEEVEVELHAMEVVELLSLEAVEVVGLLALEEEEEVGVVLPHVLEELMKGHHALAEVVEVEVHVKVVGVELYA